MFRRPESSWIALPVSAVALLMMWTDAACRTATLPQSPAPGARRAQFRPRLRPMLDLVLLNGDYAACHAGEEKATVRRVQCKNLKATRLDICNFSLFCNVLPKKSGGWGGIRTHEGLAPLPVFKTGAFDRSATHPQHYVVRLTQFSHHDPGLCSSWKSSSIASWPIGALLCYRAREVSPLPEGLTNQRHTGDARAWRNW